MSTEAVKTGYYETPYGKYPKIQILTIAELFAGRRQARHVLTKQPFSSLLPPIVLLVFLDDPLPLSLKLIKVAG
jgi:hypothetical protein